MKQGYALRAFRLYFRKGSARSNRLEKNKTNPNRVGLIFSLSDFFDFDDTVITLRGKEAILIKIYRELSPMSQDALIKVSKCMK